MFRSAGGSLLPEQTYLMAVAIDQVSTRQRERCHAEALADQIVSRLTFRYCPTMAPRAEPKPFVLMRCSVRKQRRNFKGAVGPDHASPADRNAGTRMRRMNRRRRVYEGKAKVLYEGPEPGTLIQHFKDDATAFNNKKHAADRRQGRAQQPHLRVHLPSI